MGEDQITVVGAGIGGMVAGLDLARQGFRVTVLEAAAVPGGKMSQVSIDGRAIDVGPTVLTMRWVFDEIFDDAGTSLDDCVTLEPLEVLARHFWRDTDPLDLFADLEASADAIGRFAGGTAARGYRAFVARAAAAYDLLEQPFLRRSCKSPAALVAAVGVAGMKGLWGSAPFSTLDGLLRQYFSDPRLLQMFGRYATYCGSSPYRAPATLMVIAHVERLGVWTVAGGMYRLAQALAGLATRQGVDFRYRARVGGIDCDQRGVKGVTLDTGEHIPSRAVVVAADAAALATGAFGRAARRAVAAHVARDRSLSALTWAMQARLGGIPLGRHNVFFSNDYPAEFQQLFAEQRFPENPTVYVCAQDRREPGAASTRAAERLFCLVNAPAVGDRPKQNIEEIGTCEIRTFNQLRDCGLTLIRSSAHATLSTPAEFHQRFPATGGALYGQASHGWKATFQRPAARTSIPGLYLAGGSTHPGAGVPMAALSGRIAARALVADQTSSATSLPVATPGGTSTRKATMARTR